MFFSPYSGRRTGREVIETLEKKIFTSEFSKEVSEQLQNNIQKNQEITQKQRGSISAQLQNVNSKIKNLLNLLARGIDFDELEETLSSLKQEKENLIRSLEVLNQQPKALLDQDFTQELSKLRDLQPREQSIFLQQYIDKITVFARRSNEKEVEIYIQSNIV